MALAIALYRSGRAPEVQAVCHQALRHFQTEGVTGNSLKPLRDLQVSLLNRTLPTAGPLGF